MIECHCIIIMLICHCMLYHIFQRISTANNNQLLEIPDIMSYISPSNHTLIISDVVCCVCVLYVQIRITGSMSRT